jgi:hypothetical protein
MISCERRDSTRLCNQTGNGGRVHPMPEEASANDGAAAIQCGGRFAHGSTKFPRHDKHDAKPTFRHTHNQRLFTLHTSSWITLERLRLSERAFRTSARPRHKGLAMRSSRYADRAFTVLLSPLGLLGPSSMSRNRLARLKIRCDSHST